MCDTDDEYLDDYVNALLHDAIHDVSKKDYLPPRNFVYQEETVLNQLRREAGKDGDRDSTPVTPIIETHYLRRSFSSPAIPEYGRYVRGIPPVRRASDYEQDELCQVNYYSQKDGGEVEENELEDARMVYPDHYYRHLKDPYHLNQNYMREQVQPRSNLPVRESFEEAYEKLAFDAYDARFLPQQGWVDEQREVGEESPMIGGQEYRYGQVERSEDEDSYLEDGPESSKRPIISELDGEKPITLPKPKRYPLIETSDEHFEHELSRSEHHIDYLCQRLEELVSERDDLIEYIKDREHEWMNMSDRLHAEIIDLRQQNTNLLAERFTKGRRLSKRMADTLLKSQQETDRALTTTIERQQKINELRLLVTMQQRYILVLEENVHDLQCKLDYVCPNSLNQEERGEGNFQERTHTLPQRHPAEGHRYSSINDVIHCDRSKYAPGKSTNPELATAEVFDFGGDVEYEGRDSDPEDPRVEKATFDPLEVPYVRGGLLAN